GIDANGWQLTLLFQIAAVRFWLHRFGQRRITPLAKDLIAADQSLECSPRPVAIPGAVAVGKKPVLRDERYSFVRIRGLGFLAWTTFQDRPILAIIKHLTPVGTRPLAVRNAQSEFDVVHGSILLVGFGLIAPPDGGMVWPTSPPTIPF